MNCSGTFPICKGLRGGDGYGVYCFEWETALPAEDVRTWANGRLQEEASEGGGTEASLTLHEKEQYMLS